jgi:hypothetical protein
VLAYAEQAYCMNGGTGRLFKININDCGCNRMVNAFDSATLKNIHEQKEK